MFTVPLHNATSNLLFLSLISPSEFSNLCISREELTNDYKRSESKQKNFIALDYYSLKNLNCTFLFELVRSGGEKRVGEMLKDR